MNTITIEKDGEKVEGVTSTELEAVWGVGKNSATIFAGATPCKVFSRYGLPVKVEGF